MRLAAVLLALLALPAAAQRFTERGYLEWRTVGYPQAGSNDSGRLVSDALFRYEMGVKLTPWLRFQGAFDARTDTHRQTERSARLDWQDRSTERPAFSLRRFSLTASRGNWTFEAGKQFIRWGKADLLNPVDRFAPRDFLNVVDTDTLGVLAGRLTWERGGETVELVWQPRFTPSRAPLWNQRWAPLPPGAEGVSIVPGEARRPGGSQWGIRWNHVGRGYEASAIYYEGHNHLPLIAGRLVSGPPFVVALDTEYARIRMPGAALAAPNRWFTLKAEAGYFSSRTATADEYLQYVIQAERQWGEWMFVGGYAGEAVTRRRSPLQFAPDRGIARAFLGRAQYQWGPRDTIAIETAVRQNGAGAWVRAEWTRSVGDHWQIRPSAALLRGDPEDFLGQFRSNSYLAMVIRYSF